MQELSEHRLFRHIDHPHRLASYLSLITKDYVRIALVRLRLRSHNLMIERGRWEKPKKYDLVIDFVKRVRKLKMNIMLFLSVLDKVI